MRGGISLTILETIADLSLTSVDLCLAILSAGYGASMSKIEYELNQIQSGRIRARLESEEKQRFYNLLSKLKREGFIRKNKTRFWKITSDGLKKLERLKFLSAKDKYSQQKGREKAVLFKIIAFDIPEKYKYKRNWLRSALLLLGFRMLQKSVWIGKASLPKNFMEDLDNFKLIPYVEIFSINQSGTLKQIA